MDLLYFKSFLEFLGLSWKFLEFLAFLGVFWNCLEHSGTFGGSWSFLVVPMFSWNIGLMFPRVFLNVNISGNLLEFDRVCRSCLEFPKVL